ncbi:unnamed protein product [Owenia fusiformis]|uniref:Apple domain-containing protein n=1 Tax=Owenia fusiformis TaxID=6347 RepID=A0A8S4NP97_OWEFU|nr:unnamed protein product [Owenia fusiformis]
MMSQKIFLFVILFFAAQGSCFGQDSLAEKLGKLQFKNEGVVHKDDELIWKPLPCGYLEAQNVTTIQQNWITTKKCNYLFQRKDGADVPPPSGMRSAVPLGGISTGSIELRADGTFHEWTIMNQSPASAAKIQVMDDVFLAAMTISTPGVDNAIPKQANTNPQLREHFTEEDDVIDMLINNEINTNINTVDDLEIPLNEANAADVDTDNIKIFALRTNPPNDPDAPGVEGVSALRYQGAYPVSKLEVIDDSIPVDITTYAYSSYKVGDMNASALPSIAFTMVFTNPSTTDNVLTYMIFNLGVGIEEMTQRTAKPTDDGKTDWKSPRSIPVSNTSACAQKCKNSNDCKSWTFFKKTKMCQLSEVANLNTFNEDTNSGLPQEWVVSNVTTDSGEGIQCLSSVRFGLAGPNGNITICGNNTSNTHFGTGATVKDVFANIHNQDPLHQNLNQNHPNAWIVSSVNLKPGETKSVTQVLSWFYPNRDFVGEIHGNYYSKHLYSDSLDVAQKMWSQLDDIVDDIRKLHGAFYESVGLPVFLQDLLINSLSHIRSAMWFDDGRWRQWEANDCTNIDSVHNDGERHIPYIMFFPKSTKNKMYAWAHSQLANGMIPEQLRCNPSGPNKDIDIPCGRVMSDVSSMFIVYLLELYSWTGDEAFLKEMWPYAKKAAQWHMSVCGSGHLPLKLQNTYDVLGLNAYSISAYNTGFHILALKVAQKLAIIQGDADFATICEKFAEASQLELDLHLWNETAQYYNAYAMLPGAGSPDKMEAEGRRGLLDLPVEIAPNNPGAIMTDSFYSQVLSYTLGLGPLINTTKLKLHMKAELTHNDSPYGMLVMTGRYPYPGPSQDNAIWMMGNPNWATISIHNGQNVSHAIEVAEKSLDRWRSVLNDQWNVAGLMGGLNYGADGQPWVTSHYGYYMSSWHMVMALSGQQAFLGKHNKTLTFQPKTPLPFKYPLLLPGVLGTLEGSGGKAQGHRETRYTLEIYFGEVTLDHLAVNDNVYKNGPILLKQGDSITW